jgi:hypothetical protein
MKSKKEEVKRGREKRKPMDLTDLRRSLAFKGHPCKASR